MPKEGAQEQGPSSPPSAPALADSPLSKEKSLQPTPKKFSLSSAFPLSPNRAHHYRQQQSQPRGALRIPDSTHATQPENCDPDLRPKSSPLSIRAAFSRGARAPVRNDSVSQTRKHSAPVTYRDSGVYLGEISHDPLLDMWSTIRHPNGLGSGPADGDDTEEPPLPSSAPLSARPRVRRRFRRNLTNRTPPKFGSSESSKSLPAIDAIFLNDMHGADACDHDGAQVDASFDSPRLGSGHVKDHHERDRFESSDLSDYTPRSARPARASAGIKPQRNAQSFSTENLADQDDIFGSSPSDSPDFGRSRRSDAHCRSSVRFDNLDEESATAQKLVKKRSSLYRRSRSLAENEAAKRMLENEVREELRDAAKEAHTSTGDRPRGRINLLKKSGQSTSNMVQMHTGTDAMACDRKTAAGKKKRSIADPIAKKLTRTFLWRRQTGNSLTASVGTMHSNSDSSLPSASNQTSPKPPSREEVRKWAASFENLLSHRYGVMLFRLFLQREFSEENIDFWTACEDYKKLREAKLASQARQIYNDFVAVQAPKEVNLDSVTRSSTMAALSNPNNRTFEQAQHRIQSLMEKDSYPRFLRSDLYMDLVRKC